MVVSHRLHWRVLCLLLVALLGDPARAQEPRKAGDVVIEPASMKTPGGESVDYEIGTIYVPENRAEQASRVIGVGFARFRALQPTESPPLFFLPGGPGSSYLTDLKQGSVRFASVQQMVARHRMVGDVVFVDQRGFSERGEVLKFKYSTPAAPLDEPGSLARSTSMFAEAARAAVAEFTEKRIDLRGYSVKDCADDVNELREALGYERITLMGGSFGSQWSFAVMRRHPAIVSRALLAGVEPLDCGYDMPSHVMAAVQRMWWEAEQDPRIQPYLPPGGIMEAARQVLRRLESAPAQVQLKGVKDAKTGEQLTITVGHEDLQKDGFLRGIDGPAFILSLYHGHYDSWAFSLSLARRGRNAEIPIIGPLIDSSLGVTPRRLFLLRNDSATEYLGKWNFENYVATAEIWPSPDVGDEFRTEVVCPITVVFVNGDWDTQTPIENTLQVAPYFPNRHVLIVERGGHGAMSQVAQHLPETIESLMMFLKTGSTENLPTRVTLPAPKFNVPNFPAPGNCK